MQQQSGLDGAGEIAADPQSRRHILRLGSVWILHLPPQRLGRTLQFLPQRAGQLRRLFQFRDS